MPPRKRGRGRGKAASKTTKATKTPTKRSIKTEDDDEPPPKLIKEESFNSKLKRIVKEEKDTKRKFKPDVTLLELYKGSQPQVHDDFSCMLNLANIGKNNNKFYVIQLVDMNNSFSVFTKWGRVGEAGQHDCATFNDLEEAVKRFKKKFADKTKNNWDKKDAFEPVPGKYTLLEMGYDDSDDEEDEVDAKPTNSKVVKAKQASKIASVLNERTQLLIKIILSEDMFKDQMASMQLDVKKMPLGKLSKSQILKGLNVLLDIEKEIKGKSKKALLEQLSSQFYTVIPHSFGRMVPPVISDQSVVDQKKDLMMTLTDIEIAQSLQKEEIKGEDLHPLDCNYNKFNCNLERVENESAEFKTILKYATANKNTRDGKLLDVWRVDRATEGERFDSHNMITHRKLLWHGTSVAVVAAILKAGLRIMPHSGGLVGRGIYFASEHAKSSWYVRAHNGKFEGESNIGFMFLVEVALGKMNFIKQSNGSLTAPPKGFDSVVARGRNEPDPKKDVKKKFDGKEVIIPVGSPVPQEDFKDSGFTQSEYLVYKESQARIRYLLKFSFSR